ncbi:hypothetical protein [Clostridium paridis]|uniref:Uncharacterized protein n=1 Tax=Clostridium paridis TaxID=2803863 RepID=A0A937FFL1_9CLOT|nr:hypothetical protein [Clostridium paridis]MBL4932288.1 hypothetical protein [Clostridium paridis]
MNNARRKRIEEVMIKLEELKSEIEEIGTEEAEYRDNMPENLMCSEKYEKADTACDNLDGAFEDLGEVINYLSEAME